MRSRWLSVALLPALVLGWLVLTTAPHRQSVRVTTVVAPYRPAAAPAARVGPPASLLSARLASVVAHTSAPPPPASADKRPQPPAAKPAPAAAKPAPPAAPARPARPAPPSGGCGAALAYLSRHAAPGFTFECPGNALGHQAMTCVNVAGVCPGSRVIAIAVACPASWMNEASNSWVLTGQSNMPLDPYGYCH